MLLPFTSSFIGSISPTVKAFIPSGYQSVWLFFSLSSYLLYKGFLNNRYSSNKFSGVIKFYTSRGRRLLPAFYFVQLLSIILFYISISSSNEISWEREIQILLFSPRTTWVEELSAIRGLNSVIWSIILEVNFILILPIIFLLTKKHFAVIGVIALASLVPHIHNIINSKEIFPYIYGGIPYNAIHFIAGLLAARWTSKFSFKLKNVVVWYLILYFATLASNLFLSENLCLTYFPILFAIMNIVLIKSLDNGFYKENFLNLRFLIQPLLKLDLVLFFEKLGMMSYTIYLCHKPIGYGIAKTFRFYRQCDNLFIGSVLSFSLISIVILISFLIFQYIENYFRKPRDPIHLY